jgi:hypothetical protein
MVLSRERFQRKFEGIETQPKVSDVLAACKIRLTAERDVTLLDAIQLALLACVQEGIADSEDRKALLDKLKGGNTVELVFGL